MGRLRIVEAAKRIVRRSDLLYALANVIRHRKSPGYLEYVNGYYYNPEIVLIRPGEDSQMYEGGQTRPICLIEAWNGIEGFAAGLRDALNGIYFCRRCGLQPIVRFHDDSLYKDDSFPEDMNPFEYFFETEYIGDEVIDQSPQIIYQSRNKMLAENLVPEKDSYYISEAYISAMAKIWGRDIRIKRSIQDSIDKYISERGIGSDCLAVHFRGTDYKVGYYKHPVYVAVEEYYPFIKEALRAHHFSKIYIATDDVDALHDMIRDFGIDKVIYDEKMTRASGLKGVHTTVGNGYKNGADVLKDMSGLAACGGLISGASKVAQMARIIKRSKGQKYSYDKCIFNGIVKHGKELDSLKN